MGVTAAIVHPTTGSATSAQGNWSMHCARCHANDGTGRTKYGDKMRLLDYTKPETQRTFTDDYALDATRQGAKDPAGNKVMPGYADKLTEEEIRALLEHVRAFARTK